MDYSNMAGGVVRALAAIIPMLVMTGLIDTGTSEQLLAILPRFYEVLFGASGLIAVAMAAWSIWSNRPKALAAQTASVEGLVVAVGPSAPAGPKKLAADASHPDVIPAPVMRDKEPQK
jgi:hypothetical protein